MSEILRRGRLSSTPDEDILNFTSSMSADKWIFEADILVDLAHTVMLKEQSIIREQDCSKILKGLLQIREDGIGSLDHSYEDIHISLESRLIDMVGEDVGGRMHSGRSRNDEVVTCIRIRLRDELLSLMEELSQLRKNLLDMASENKDTLMPGFTHLQHAQPTTFAHHLLAHSGALSRDTQRLMEAFSRVNECPLGAAAFASTGFLLDRERTRSLLGFERLIENSMDAVSSRDFMIESASILVNIMVNLSKMAEEIVIWSTTEFGFIELHDSYSSTSSIMPQKKNPDTAELIRGKSGTVIGSLMALISICKALPLSYNRDLQEATPNLWRAVETTRGAARVMAGIFATLEVNTDAMSLQSTAGFTTATELADTMVRAAGIPFRTAHQIVGVLARENRDPTPEDIDAAARNVLGENLSERGLSREMVKEALDPLSNISKRSITGGPSPNELERAIRSCFEELELEHTRITEFNNSIEHSLNALFTVVDRCIESSSK
ncbi:argininosuccinate lyase [Methanolobus halotolerans]|uniref:Argininosuccinate lyase n=1 Tax=Methanolobus halotolerans TaxID=2052935 RepID=A0A4E0Q685_9EURY|nr:argininosuccinate lyase [Methanolobus halotolerans]TGC09516.1 argininosuccinate lyase [Methanolobus halotolerans]